MALYAVIPAAGIGRRMGGGLPKQYLPLAGEPLLAHSLRALLNCADIRRVAVALHPEDEWAGSLPALADPRVLRVTGGAERADSVLAGLDGLQEFAYEKDWVLVHDAARPCLAARDLQALIDAVTAVDEGGILAQPVVDTLKRAVDGRQVEATVDRHHYWRAQTPQMFRLGELRAALVDALAAGVAVTDEASAMEWAGHPVQLVEGSPANLKVTVAADLPLAEWYLRALNT
ncbi:2-C-methyl-D-erythritol 4-phosphate cytidylyltransferase [Parahaliea aestuarii]|uniref:2-C-methyl-D-erythritol 4-phosphate cytidylyltransferase n=1 Tax=Parahaliea aestuarii TaxID=1852021 RepID=A0A5C8ZYS8_9GAMM|nr:2-C-methyl-D-erythritol 4-phosphate cytidylyltransferase [Parahaliea aestuarii]TXS93646.1 2-C-methyl-D-erythritol 4-phosphate cytidylyltransferase [Parahaliea aestuarii]